MNKTNHPKIILLGDSITNGFDGTKDLTHNLTYFLTKLLPFADITNAGVNAGTISGNTERDLTFQVNHHHFVEYNLATIFYGTNDYAHSDATLEIVGRILGQNIQKIRDENPEIKLLGILPLPRFDGGAENLNNQGYSGYTVAELLEKLTATYQKEHIPVLNWRTAAPDLLNNNNYYQRLGDHRLHPNADTYQRMAAILASFIETNLNK